MQVRRSGRDILVVAVGVLSAMMFAGPVLAVEIVDDPVQIDERAAQLVQTSNSLCWEMHRYHQQQPEFQQTYRQAKEIWTKAGELREALRAGPVETDQLMQQLTEIDETFGQVETTLLKWGNGDRSTVPNNSGPGQRTIVTPGTEVDLPLLSIRVGRPQVVVTEDGPPQLERRRLHPNSPGSKRSLERELASVKVALDYLAEDAGMVVPPNATEADASATSKPVVEPPVPDPTLGDPQKIPPTAKGPATVPPSKED